MDFDIKKLVKNELFKNMDIADLELLLKPDTCIVGRYKKNALITQEGELCDSVGFILDGSLSVQQLSPTGDLVNIQVMNAGDCFGLARVFSTTPYYLFNLMTIEDSSVLFIPFMRIREMIRASSEFNESFITFLSNRVTAFQRKISILSQKDVRSRLILYFSNQYGKTKKLRFKLPHSKTDIANLIGVARPSVSRELKHMQDDGLITIERNIITINKPELFTFSPAANIQRVSK